MSVTPQKFIDLAASLIGDKFLAFAKDCTLKTTTGFNYSTQRDHEVTQTVKMIRIDYKSSQFEKQAAMNSDYMLVGELAPITIVIRPDMTEAVFDGENVVIQKIERYDQAAILLHVKRK